MDLGFFCLGNGITVCDRSTMEHNDYKYIAHINPAGHIKFYIDRNSIPEADLAAIRKHAYTAYTDFIKYWKTLTVLKQYEIIYDRLTLSEQVSIAPGASMECVIARNFNKVIERL